MALAHAFYRQTATTRSDGTNWPSGTFTLSYNSDYKTSPLVTRTNTGTPNISEFRLLAPGVWRIGANHQWTGQSNTLWICTANSVNNIVSGSPVGTYTNVSVERAFNYNQAIFILANLPAAAAMGQGAPELNGVSFTYLGAI